MSRKCELSGVGVHFGNNVSHSQRKTRRRFEPNMRVVRYMSELSGQTYSFRVNARCMRTVDKVGGFDEYMLKVSSDLLSDRAKSVKNTIVQKKKGVVNEA